jgi:glycosyltransferase involved in cell wall biosynthesis
MNLSISAIVLTKNEALNLERCFNSLQWCGEIVVVDSGSTDGTQEVAESLGAKVYTHIQPPPFRISEQRNWALENCDLKGEWVLFSDADETIPTALAVAIQKICTNTAYSGVS